MQKNRARPHRIATGCYRTAAKIAIAKTLRILAIWLSLSFRLNPAELTIKVTSPVDVGADSRLGSFYTGRESDEARNLELPSSDLKTDRIQRHRNGRETPERAARVELQIFSHRPFSLGSGKGRAPSSSLGSDLNFKQTSRAGASHGEAGPSVSTVELLLVAPPHF